MSNGTTAGSVPAKRYLAALIALLLLLVALALAYYFMTKPPDRAGAEDRDRNFLFSIYGFEGDLLRRPNSATVDNEGNIHVADTGKKRIVMFDDEGDYITTYGDFGKDTHQIWDPIDVAVAADGRSYVVDKTLKKLVLFDATHQPYHEVVFEEEAPLSVAIKDEQIFVTTESGVVVGDLDANFITGYVQRGKEPGSFDRPAGIAVDDEGVIYVADSLNYRVQAIGTDGEPLWQYGEPVPAGEAVMFSGEDRKFGLPASVAVDENGYVYVVDGLNSELVVLTNEGEHVETIGDVGHDDGMFYYPDGIDYAGGRLVIADKFNDRIEVFTVPTAQASTVVRYLPYGALLLLLPLLLVPIALMRRRVNYIATPDFVTSLATDTASGAEVASAVKKVHGTKELAESAAMLNLPLEWKPRSVEAERTAGYVERFGLAQPEARALAIASTLGGRRVLLTDTPGLHRAAAELELGVLGYQEVKSALVESADETVPTTKGVAEGSDA